MPDFPRSDNWQLWDMLDCVERVRKYKHEYYNEEPTVDDRTYDLWWFNLLALEKKYPHLIQENTPSQTVGAPLPADAAIVEHAEPMLSVETTDLPGIDAWMKGRTNDPHRSTDQLESDSGPN